MFFLFCLLDLLSPIYTALFPKTLPRAAVRRVIQQEKNRRGAINGRPEITKASVHGMLSGVLEHHLFDLLSIFVPARGKKITPSMTCLKFN